MTAESARRLALVQAVRAAPTKKQLRMFATPIRLADLPRPDSGGYSTQGWQQLILAWDLAGLITSPGKSPLWRLTAAGWKAMGKVTTDQVKPA